jgi:thiamine pyrophosphokinase
MAKETKQTAKTVTEVNTDKKDTKELTDRQKALELALLHIEKQFGKGSIMKLGSKV